MARMLLYWLVIATVVCCVDVGSSATNSGGFEALYVFGDSLFDPGNRHLLKPSAMGLPFPIIDSLHLPYGRDFPTHQPTGRFCDGLLVPDILATYVGLPYPPAYLKDPSNILQGASFATSGAKIMNNTSPYQFPRLNFADQVDRFAEAREELVSRLGAAEASAALSQSLFLIALGSNDLIDYIINIKQRLNVTPQEFYPPLVTTYTQLVQRLYSMGARKLALTSVPALGCMPAMRAVLGVVGPGYWQCVNNANQIAQGFNAELLSVVNELQSTYTDARFVYLNSYDPSVNAINDPLSYGLLYGLQPCCGFNEDRVIPSCFQGLNAVCIFAGQHVFWDFAHPTQAFNYVLAQLYWQGSSPDVVPMNLQQLASF